MKRSDCGQRLMSVIQGEPIPFEFERDDDDPSPCHGLTGNAWIPKARVVESADLFWLKSWYFFPFRVGFNGLSLSVHGLQNERAWSEYEAQCERHRAEERRWNLTQTIPIALLDDGRDLLLGDDDMLWIGLLPGERKAAVSLNVFVDRARLRSI